MESQSTVPRQFPQRNKLAKVQAISGQTSPRRDTPAPLPFVRNRKILHSWKEISNYLGRGVRTVQRYEVQLQLPIRRPAGSDRSAVMAFSDELDAWLNRAPKREQRHVKCVLLLLDRAPDGALSARRAALEIGNFNVLAVSTAEEMFETAERFDVDGFVLDWDHALASEICESLNERHPSKPIFAILPESTIDGNAPKCGDYVIPSGDDQKLMAALLEVFGGRKPE